jgi:kumamolisin
MDNAGMSRIAGSELGPPPGYVRVDGALDRAQEVMVTLQLRRQGGVELPGLGTFSTADITGLASLPRKQYVARFGAAPRDIESTLAFARKAGLQVVDEARHPARSWQAGRSIAARGSVATLEKTFGVELALYRPRSGDGGTFIGREGSIFIDPAMGGIVEYVFGLDARPIGRRGETFSATVPAANLLKPQQVAAYYNFPAATGKNQRIALMEFGGGAFANDLVLYFTGEGMGLPSLTPIPIDGQSGQPGTNERSDIEVTADICVAGVLAPDAAIDIYFAPHTEQGWIHGIAAAVNAAQRPSVISISWGAPEYGTSRTLTWSRQGMRQMSRYFQDAAQAQITVLASSGDSGADCGIDDRWLHVNYPASDPGVIACGGTIVDGNPAPTGERTWPQSGGGVSREFGLPAWQASAGVPTQMNTSAPGRGVPDVAGYAAPGFAVYYQGNPRTVPGTSMTAPMYAALFARINELAGRKVGFVLDRLYQSKAFVDLKDGVSNASTPYSLGYTSTAGWDAVTGLGRADGTKLKDELLNP